MLTKALELLLADGKEENQKLIADVYYYIGMCHYETQRFQEAILNFQEGISLFKAINDSESFLWRVLVPDFIS